MTQRRRTRFTRQEVAAALKAWIEQRGDRPFTQETAKRAVNKALNGFYDALDFTTELQAVRVLNGMAGPGTLLRKAGYGQRGPDGTLNLRKQPDYYTEEAWKAAEAKAAEQARHDANLREERERIHDELVRRGLVPRTTRGESPRLSTAGWFRLLGLDGD